MKVHTTAFKEQIKEMGRELDSIITFGDTVLGAEELNAVTPSFQGAILKSVMKQLDIDSNVYIPVGTILNYKFGVKVDGEYEYLDFGNYVVKEVEKQEDTNSYKITCYDKLLFSMKDYVKMPITYPITIREYINSLCTFLGLSFANKNDTFANYDKEIPYELYLDSNGNSLGYTFRDVFDELTQVTASTICINDNDEVEIRYINDTGDIIDEEFLKDVNVNFGERYGKVNSIVLSRSGESDNVYLQDETSVAENGLCELKIIDNQVMNFNDRSDYLPDILEKLNGLEYYLNDFSSTGITYYDLCDRYNVKIGDNIYSCVMFNDEILVTQGLEENIYTEIPEETETDYKKASKTDRLINQTYLIVDKQVGEIRGVVESVETTVNNITTTKQTSKGGNHLYIEDAMETNSLEYIVEGKSEQETTNGNQLVDFENYTSIYSYTTSTFIDDMLTVTCTEGTYRVVGWDLLSLAKANPGKTLYFSFEKYDYSNASSSGVNILQVNNDVTTYPNLVGTKGNQTAVTIPEDVENLTTFTLRVMPNNSSTSQASTLVITKPMLHFGTDELEYERYTGGIASPNPEYPSEIKTVKGIRNVFNLEEYPFINMVAYNKYGEKVSWEGYCGIEKYFPVEEKIAYSFTNNLNKVIYYGLVYYDESKNMISMADVTTGINQFTTPEKCKYIRFAIKSDVLPTWVQIEEGLKIHDPVPYGSWLEVKNTGKNLLDVNGLTNTGTSNGITWTRKDDGSILLNGTATANTFIQIPLSLELNKDDTYTFYAFNDKKFNNSNSMIRFNFTDNSTFSGAVLNVVNAVKSVTYTGETKEVNYFQIRINSGEVLSDVTLKPMLLKSNDTTQSYEPYKEQSTLIDMNKPNLFDVNNLLLNQTLGDTGSTVSNSDRNTLDYTEIKGNTTYTISNLTLKNIIFYDENQTFISKIYNITNFTTPNDAKYVRIAFDNTVSFDNGIIYEGYDPYYELSSINEKDILTIQNGQATINQKIRKRVLDGSENWQMQPSATIDDTYLYNLQLDDSYAKDISTISCLSDYFTPYSSADLWNNPYIGISLNDSKNLRIRTNIVTTDEFKTYLSENPVTVYYILAEPQTIELGEFPIMLYNNINNITLMSDLNTTTQITYLRNTPLSNDYATNQRVDKTDSDLESTNDSLNQTKQDVENTALDLHNNYYDKGQIDSIITTTEEEISTLKQTVETNTSSTNLQISVIEEQLKNGVTAVKTETGYTFDKDGLNISKTGSEMSSTLDNDGLSVKRDNTEVLTVRSAGVETENLKVRTYFTIGSHTRVEDYGNGTGFFHIGGV